MPGNTLLVTLAADLLAESTATVGAVAHQSGTRTCLASAQPSNGSTE
ncbi:MAG: hypothetical protein ACRDPW_03065 [Mycobacteriales bacterium]